MIAVLSVNLWNVRFELLIEHCYSVGEILKVGLEFLEFDNLAFFWRDWIGLVDEDLKIWDQNK